jgi:Tfp pilus assembly protein PilW
MATSGSKSVTVTSWDTLKFSWAQVSQSIPNNTTTVSWTLQLIAGSSGKISSTASKDWSVTVNGTNYSGTNTVGISNNATKTLASGKTTISHDADGTKSFSYSLLPVLLLN